MKTLQEELSTRVEAYDFWSTRRRYGPKGANNLNLWVLACMDERLPVDEALGIHVDTPAGHGDAHCFRNAGGIVTDDAIRSDVGSVEARNECRDSIVAEPKRCSCRFVNLGQCPDAAVDRHGRHLCGLTPEQIARGIDAVDADVIECATPERAFRADIASPDPHREG